MLKVNKCYIQYVLSGGGGTANGSGNFDAYSGLQPITDSLLSGVGNGNSNGEDLLGGNVIRKSEHHPNYSNKSSSINTNTTTTGNHQFGGQHTRASLNPPGSGLGMVNSNNNNNNSGGPLMDFKSAFSVLDDKPGNLG